MQREEFAAILLRRQKKLAAEQLAEIIALPATAAVRDFGNCPVGGGKQARAAIETAIDQIGAG